MMLYDDKNFIGEIIRKARKNAKMKQSVLAEKIEMSDKNLGNIENGKQFPQINNFFRILEVLNLSLEDFGVNTEKKENYKKINLIKKIYTLSDIELDIYIELVNIIDKISYNKYL